MSLLDPQTSDYFGAGWGRWLGPDSVMLYASVVAAADDDLLGDLDQAPPESPTGQCMAAIGGLDAVLDFGDEDEPVESGEPDFRTITDRAATHYGMTVRCYRDLLELMRRAGLVTWREEEGTYAWRPVSPVPLPAERLNLTPDEQQSEDAIRWSGLHQATEQEIIQLFEREDSASERVTTLTFSLRVLGERLGTPPESVRHGVLLLLKEGDFESSADIERVEVDAQFALTVDWQRFAEQRITLVFGDPPQTN